jgi:hypothetical protein
VRNLHIAVPLAGNQSEAKRKNPFTRMNGFQELPHLVAFRLPTDFTEFPSKRIAGLCGLAMS